MYVCCMCCVLVCVYVCFVLEYVCCVLCISVCLCVFCVYVHTSVCVVCLRRSLSRAENWRRCCPLRGAGGGSWSHLIPVDPPTMQGQRDHTHPTGAIVTHRHGDARRGHGREVVVMSDKGSVGVCEGGWCMCSVCVCACVCMCVCHSVRVNVS